ncbi:MAG: ABC transporter permease DevC [Myxococcota bacterium]
MDRRIPVAWLQLSREKLRLLVALSGVSFAVILVFMQLGFRGSVYESATRYHRSLDYDLVMLSPKTPFIGFPESFSRRRLYQALAAEEVEAIAPIYVSQAYWKNPWQYNARNILVLGIDPTRRVFTLPDVKRQLALLPLEDVVLFDALSRPEFGPVAERFAQEGRVSTEVNERHVTVAGLFELGTSFGIDGSLVTSDVNFRRIFPDRPIGHVELGLLQLRPGVDAVGVGERLAAALEDDVVILTRDEWIGREGRYWASTTPIGFVFGFGAIMGLVVGGVIVYQILFADVSQHLAEYATLKAMGYSNAFLSQVVLREAAILTVLGFIPGLLVSIGLYRFTSAATRLPLEMTPGRAALVLLLTAAMCGTAALVALRKVRSADPAEIFG